MRFADRTGAEVWATKRKRKTAVKRDRAGKLAARAVAMHLLRRHHGFLLEDLADAFQMSKSRASEILGSVGETLDKIAG